MRPRNGFSDMDWDKLKVFHAAAEAGSFTHAGEQLGLSQSAVSRQVSALEQELSVSLFHRHARGLILTEQGDLLFRTAHDVFMQLQAARAKLTDSRERPSGELKVTTTPGVGIHWLIPRLGEFTQLYPDIRVQLMVTDEELDLSMREADVAIRVRKPTQPDLIQRKLFSIGYHAYCSPEYIKRMGTPRTLEDLDNHRLIVLSDLHAPGASAEPLLADRGRPQRQRSARSLFQGEPRARSRACVPAGPRRRSATGLSGGGTARTCAAVRGEGFDPDRHLLRLSGRAEVRGARASIPRFHREQSATLVSERVIGCVLRTSDMRAACLLRMSRVGHSGFQAERPKLRIVPLLLQL